MKWVEVLNRAVSWSDFDVASRLREGSGALQAAEHARLVAEAALLRRVFAAFYLDCPVSAEDRQMMLQWLRSVTLSMSYEDSGDHRELRLGGERQRQPLPAPFEAWLTGALLQFLATVSESTLFASVHRCQGLLRQAPMPLLPAELEQKCAEKAGLRPFLSSDTTEPALSQCPQLVFSQRGRRFCSKACSNANFAARKAHKDPQYFAEKQERYRSRQKQEETVDVSREGAFVYID